jgi:methionine-S-sulfoxide reductase
MRISKFAGGGNFVRNRAWVVVMALSMAALGQAQESPPLKSRFEKATFAAGCFWSIQPPFDQTPGVIKTVLGYAGGQEANPTYPQVGEGKTGHAESIEVTYDPERTTYEKLLDVFWHNIDPTQKDRQFPDWGHQYRTAIFYHNEAQRRAAMASKERWEKDGRFGAPIVTEIVLATRFWPAEDYHQKYYLKSSEDYHRYHDHSGREEYFKQIWGK